MISIHALRVEGDPEKQTPGASLSISIHALRVEGDAKGAKKKGWENDFNPRPPCGGRRLRSSDSMRAWIFQSTPSVWRATAVTSWRPPKSSISIHALRVEGDLHTQGDFSSARISIHALRVEGDGHLGGVGLSLDISIHALRVEGDRRPARGARLQRISIHALRVEGDRQVRRRRAGDPHFNPRPPCGGRRWRTGRSDPPLHFNPRPPCGGRRPSGP